MDKKGLDEIRELSVRFADRVKAQLEKGDSAKALELLPELAREDKNMYKLLSQVISQFLVPFITERFLAGQKDFAGQIEEAVKGGEKEKAIELIDKKTDTYKKIHDAYIDFMGDCFGLIYDSWGQQALMDFYQKWGDSTKEWFIKRSKLPAKERAELGTMLWREHIGNTRIEEHDGKYRVILDPCGSGCRRLDRLEKGISVQKSDSSVMKEPQHLVVGDRPDVPIYCTHCPHLFETLCIEWTGKPVWVVNPPMKAGDPCIHEVSD